MYAINAVLTTNNTNTLDFSLSAFYFPFVYSFGFLHCHSSATGKLTQSRVTVKKKFFTNPTLIPQTFISLKAEPSS